MANERAGSNSDTSGPEHGPGPPRDSHEHAWVRRRGHRWLILLVVALVCGSAVGLAVAWSRGTTSRQGSGQRADKTAHPAPHRSNGVTGTTQPVASSWASAGDGLQPAVPPTAVPDQYLNNLLATQRGPGWIGGDSVYSTKLADGREAFVFSDTLIGTARPDGTDSFTGMARNSELVGVLPDLAQDYGGTYDAPSTLIPDDYDSDASWETFATYTQGNDQMIFVNEYGGPLGILTLKFTGRSGIAAMSVPAGGVPTLSSVTLLPTDPDTEWGSAVVESGGYLYVYGADLATTTLDMSMKVARVPETDALDVSAWSYWNGSGWVAGESNAALVPTVNQLTGVTSDPDGHGFIAVSIPAGVWNDSTVDLSYASSPTGPWTEPQPVYAIPQVKQYQGELAYSPTFHPDLSSGDHLVVSYSIDTTLGFPELMDDIHSYQPQFLIVTG